MAKKKSTKVAVRPMTFDGAVTPIGVDASWTGLAVTAVTALVHGAHDMKPTGVRMSEVLSTKPGDFPSQSARLERLGLDFLVAVFIGAGGKSTVPAGSGDCGPALVAIEGYAQDVKWGREMSGELGGHLRLLLWQAGIPYIIVPPKSLKKYVFGGTAKKSMMMMKALERWGYASAGEDECDAYCLARIAAEFAAGGWTKKFEALAQGFEVVGVKA